ncbi:hypothetical protein G6F59_017491 [Rhizopus arrhizus]|nr:hypothetical protein G6F59_017491 [Rhizopus arrhizus]
MDGQFHIGVVGAVAADGALDHGFGATGQAQRPHVPGGVGADIAHGIHDLGAQHGRRQPAVERAGHAVLADDEAVDARCPASASRSARPARRWRPQWRSTHRRAPRPSTPAQAGRW